MTTTNITLSKGSLSVEINTIEVSEEFKNEIEYIKSAQDPQSQDAGPVITQAIDLLIITRQFVVRGFIGGTAAKTPKQVKADLVSMFQGANTAGGEVTLTYDTDPFNVYIERMTIIERAIPSELTPDKTIVQYEVSLTLVKADKI